MQLTITVLLTAILFTGCATKQTKKEVEEKIKVSEVKDPEALKVTIESALENSRHLTPVQRKEIERILSVNKRTAEELSEKSYQFRGVLIQELLAEKANRKKISFIKNNIRDIEKKRLKNTLETIEKISSIVSTTPDRQHFSGALLRIEPMR